MEHLFLLNPAAGKKNSTLELSQRISSFMDTHGLSYRIRVSEKRGDITAFAREAADSGIETRIYACGGDGTLNEAVNGIVGCKTVSLTNIPCGTGNDFLRMFSDVSAFRSPENFLSVKESLFDTISCGEATGINICSIGFDAKIAGKASELKRYPLISGHGAYLLAVVAELFQKLHAPYRIECNGKRYDGNRTMISVCSGRYYGGGFNPIPDSDPCDGKLEILLVKPISILEVAKVISPFKEGKYKTIPSYFDRLTAEEITIHSDEGAVVNVDGEIYHSNDVTFRVNPASVRFFYPACVELLPPEV